MSRFRFLLLFKCAILLAGFFLFPDAKAQQSVGIGTSTPNPNAILDISSDRQGLLVPRLSSSQRLQMAQILQSSSGNEGMIVFDTEKGKFYYWFEGEWKEGLGAISSSEVAGDLNGDIASPLVVGLQGRAIANTTPATNQVLKWNGSAWTPASDVGREYSAGEGIEINDGALTNTGDLNGGDDVLITDIAGGDLGGTFSNLSIKNNAVSSSKIANEAITTAKVGDEAITTEKLADAAVTPSKIQAGSANSILAVGADGTIQWQSKSGFMDSQLEPGKILIGNASGEAEERNLSGDVSLAANGEITIEDGAINSNKILDGSVATVDIADNAITREKIAGNVAGSGLIQEADGSIAVNAGTALNITGDALNLSNTGVTTGDYGQKDKVAQFTVDAQGRIVAATEVDIEALPAGLAGGDLSGSYPNPTIRDGAITQTKIANDAVGVPQIKNDDPNAILITDPSGNPRWFETYANHVIVTSVDGQIIQENRNNFATSSLQNGYIFIGGPDNKATSISANTAGNILIGNGSGLSSVDVSGDVDIAITGVTTVQPAAINNAKLANDAVTSAKILDGSIATTDLADGSVTGTKLGANAVTTDKISDGTIVNADLAANSVNSSNIVDGTIVAVDLANDAVTTNKITNEAVTSVKILDGTITDEDLNKATIPLSGFGVAEADVDLGANRLVDVADPAEEQDAATKRYVDDQITGSTTLAEGHVYIGDNEEKATAVDASTSGNILVGDGTTVNSVGVTGDVTLVADGTITIEEAAVTSAKIADGTISTADFADGSVNNLKIAADAVTSDKIADGTIINADLAANSVNSGNIVNGTIITEDLANDAVTTIKIADGAVTSAKILDGTITDEDLNKATIPLSGFGVAEAAVNLGTNKLVDVADPTDAQDAATKNYVDAASAADGDKDATNEIQDLALSGNSLSLSGDDTPVDLSPYLDNTDDQQLNLDGNNLELENGGSVDLSGYLDNTDNQDLEHVLNVGNDAGGIAITNLANPTEDQDAATKNYVDAASAADGDKDATNEIQDLSLSGNSLSLSGDDTPVDLSLYLDNTDGQQLSLDGNNLELENGGSVDLSGYLDNTDNQNLEHVLNVGNDAGGIAITNLADPTEEQDAATKNYVDAASAADGDKDATNEIQDLSLSGNSLSLSGDDTPVDLSLYLDNTDGQQLSLDGNNLELENGGSVDLSGYLDNTDNQDLEHVLNVGNDAGGIAITNLADPTEDQDAATKNYVDEQITTSNALPEGHVYVGDADDTSTAVDASASGNILVGDGTTVNSVAVSGDMSLSSDGTATIGEGTITSAKILDGSIATTDLADGSISGAKLGANAVTSDKIADGTIVNADLAANSVNSSNIIDGTIGAGDLANDAVTTSKIVDGAVTSAKILDGTISTVDLADGIVTNAKLGANAITSDKIVDGTITSEDLAPNVINSSNIVDGSVLNSDIADGAVSSEKILDGSIINDDVANNAIHFEKLNRSGASGGQVMVWSTLLNRWTPGNATNIIGGSSGDITAVTTPAGSGLQGGRESGDMILTLTNSGNGEILIGDGTNVNPATVTGDISLSSSGVATITTNAVQEVNIENNAVSSSKIQNAAITVAKIGQNGATNGQVLKWNGSAWAASDDNVNDGDASATNELQNLSISGNAISISSGNSVNISSVAPSENQVLTYKSGNWTASNPSTTGAIVRTGNYAIDPLDFVGLGSDGTESIFYYGDGDFVSSENDGKIAAPVHLTDGVQITEIQFHFHDAQNGQNMSFSLTRKSRNSGSSEVLATVNSAGDPGNDVRTLTAINHNIVDNGLYSYRVIVDLKGESYGSAKRHRVYSVIIKYTETIN